MVLDKAYTLPESMFTVFAKPACIPQPPHLPRIAQAVYSHWRERQLERAGHPIIPSVNLDKTETRNESYICFRRRETKAVRKTRAQRTTYSDRMLRLQAELVTAEGLAKGVLQCEHLKRETAVQARAVWEKRFTFADLKRKFPALGTKDDEELFHDKERIPKKPRIETRTIKFRAPGELASPVFHAEPQIKPKERQAQIQSQIEQEMAARKEKDHHWEDAIDNPYQPTPAPYASKLWRAVAAMRNAPSSSSASTTPDQPLRAVRAGRLRYGRGGRLHLDRRTITPYPWGAPDFLSDEDKNDVEAQDRARRLAERWRYDEDDALPVGSEGPDEKDRILVDDFQPKYLAHHMSLLTDQDRQSLITDATITITASDGRQQTHTPFRVVAPERRIATPSTRAGSSHMVAPGQPMSALHSSSSALSLTTSGTPVSMSSPFKKMPSSSVPHLRISSLGNMRPPGLPSIPNIQSAAMSVSLSSPHTTPPLHTGQASSIHDANGLTTVSGEQNGKASASVNSDNHLQPLNHQAQADGQSVPPSASPMRPKAQVQPQAITIPNVSNGYHIGSTNPYQSAISAPYMHSGNRSLTMQQMQSLKSAFASMAPTPDPSLQLRTPASYGDQNRSGYPPMAAARQWNQHQRPPSVNSTEATGMDSIATPVMSPPLPTRTPSANGMHNHLSRVQSVNHSIVQPQGRASPANAHIARLTTPMSPSPHLLSASLAAVQPQSSPSRSPQPPMATPSPSMQPRHVLGTGY